MSEVITLLTSVSGHSLVKSFSGTDITPQPFSTGKLFNVSEEPVSDLQSLSALLQRLENDPKHTVIRGSLTDDQSSPVPRNKEAFTATPRQWCMIDIDSLSWDGDTSDQKAMLTYAIQQLPPEFQSADCWYHLSSSMGIKDGVNVHLWFWLERRCSDNELKTWLSGCPVDMRMFNPIQIHLTANPQFRDGAVDPYPNRSGLFEAGTGISTVTVPSDLAFRSAVASKYSKQRTRGTYCSVPKTGYCTVYSCSACLQACALGRSVGSWRTTSQPREIWEGLSASGPMRCGC